MIVEGDEREEQETERSAEKEDAKDRPAPVSAAVAAPEEDEEEVVNEDALEDWAEAVAVVEADGGVVNKGVLLDLPFLAEPLEDGESPKSLQISRPTAPVNQSSMNCCHSLSAVAITSNLKCINGIDFTNREGPSFSLESSPISRINFTIL